ncbi:MAG: chloramphenicol acetyltransferase [Lachnospiraceae bacterium]|nr:chloramphenicol acetyltransferase [Lachnospiraceae bacterium]
MGYRYLDMDTYKRKTHFAYFNSLSYPYCGITVNVDITDLLEKIKKEGLPFFFTVCFCVSKAANGVAQFRQRILDGRIIEFDRCKTSHTVALEDGTYCYCTLEDDMPFSEYTVDAALRQEEAKQMHTIDEEEDEVYDKFFISTLPWISYTAIVQPVPVPADSNPRITWGRYFEQGGRILLPVSVLCHHALVDGVHLARFYELLEAQFSLLTNE